MIRGMYTGASGMIFQQERLDAVANNLANVDTTAYKEDEAIGKAFPELLLRRLNTNVKTIPDFPNYPFIGSVDQAPVVGKLGTGVEMNEIYTIQKNGSMKETKNPFDLALQGDDGFFVVETPNGERLTRNGSFLLGPEGMIVTKEGYPVLGENGPITAKLHNIMIDQEGRVFQNNRFADDPNRLVSMEENDWDQTAQLDRIRIVTVDQPRYLQKQGSSLYTTTPDSGESYETEGQNRALIRQGFIETSNVNAVKEMVKMIEVNRAYEANQKVVQAQDQNAEKLLTQVFKV